MQRIGFSLLLILACSLVQAQVAPKQLTASWLAPTTNTDGSAYVPAASAGYNVYVASTDAALTAMPNVGHGTTVCPAAGPSLGCATAVQGTTTLSVVSAGLVPGTYFFAVTAWTCPTATTCQESAQSVHASGTIAAPPPSVPSAPTGLTLK
jgi:hypothetical protein